MSRSRSDRWLMAAGAVAGLLLAGLLLAGTIIVVFHILPGQPNGPTPGTLNPTATSPPPTGPLPAHCRYRPQNLPDRACNPGTTNPAVTQKSIDTTICVRGWTATVRPPASYTNAIKRQEMNLYGDDGALIAYEEDHIIPLEVGGNPTDPRNLYPEPWAGAYGAHAKDRLENAVRRAVCDGRLTLAEGQAVFEGDWWRYSG